VNIPYITSADYLHILRILVVTTNTRHCHACSRIV